MEKLALKMHMLVETELKDPSLYHAAAAAHA
jgi:hypothetical protein